MNVHKVRPLETKGKSLSVEDFDHFVAVDWSIKTMAVAHMGRRRKEPKVFEHSSNVTALKEY